jgi:hypothetical protein
MMVPVLLPLTQSDNKNSAKGGDWSLRFAEGLKKVWEAEDNDKITASRITSQYIHVESS